ERLADCVAILGRGRIVACGPPTRLRASAGGDSIVHIALGGPCATAAVIAARVTGVIAPRLIQPAAAGPTLTYRTADPARTNPEVIASLVAPGAAIRSGVGSPADRRDDYRERR